MSATVYGYARVSTEKQSIDRQIRNIKELYPDAAIFQEKYTGRHMIGRVELEKLLHRVKAGDTIVFDSVSRMSRNAAEGIELYEQLHAAGVNLVFIKERHIDTATYDKAMADSVPMTGTAVDCILKGVNEYMRLLAREQIRLAFEQSEKEVDDLRQRTREGIQTARMNGKQIGQVNGTQLHVKKAQPAKERIKELSKSFAGMLDDGDVMQIVKLSRNTYYKYKAEIKSEMSK